MSNYSKMYIAVRDEAPEYMVPTLVAHASINAHIHFYSGRSISSDDAFTYGEWLHKSFRKVVVRVNNREYQKIKDTLVHFEGSENTICNGEGSCLVVLPVENNAVPNVLKYAKLWKPKEV